MDFVGFIFAADVRIGVGAGAGAAFDGGAGARFSRDVAPVLVVAGVGRRVLTAGAAGGLVTVTLTEAVSERSGWKEPGMRGTGRTTEGSRTEAGTSGVPIVGLRSDGSGRSCGATSAGVTEDSGSGLEYLGKMSERYAVHVSRVLAAD